MDSRIEKMKKIGIAGAGIMGASMAQIFAVYGYDVTVYDISQESINKGSSLIRINQETAVSEGRITAEGSSQTVERIRFTMSIADFADMDFLVEAIVEKMEIKHRFWKEVSAVVREDAILASNTSGLSITGIAEAVSKPERFGGMHWINPPHIIPLVEVISGERTAPETAELISQMAEKVGRKPVKVKKDIPGFLLNRFQFAILREAMSIVDQGAAEMEDIDNVFKYGMGLRYACLGPFEIADLGGLDTFYNIADYLFSDISDTKEISPLLKEPYEAGNYGVKSGKGYYDYSGGRDREVIAERDKRYMKVAEALFKEKKKEENS